VKQRPALFDGRWQALDGKQLRRVTRREMAEIWRLWIRHADVREGRTKEQREAREAGS
jgi:hypothetical protein